MLEQLSQEMSGATPTKVLQLQTQSEKDESEK